jgi:hypothetical protein
VITTSLDIQQSMYELAIKSNALEVMVKLIDVIAFSSLFKNQKCFFMFPKYFKLEKIATIQVLGNVKHEWCFRFLAFYKTKLHD